MFKFHCPHCQQKLSAEATQSGATMPCPSCGAELRIPSPPAETEAEIASPQQAAIKNPSESPAKDQNTVHPSSAQAIGQSPQKGFELPQTIKSLASNKQASAVLADLRSMDFKAEIAPVDSNIIALIKKDFVFWAVSLLGIVPLVLVTLNDTQSQLTGFLLFFATIWGVIFKKFIVDENSSWSLPIAALFFTGIIGIRGLLFVHEYLPDFYMNLPNSENILLAFIGGIFQTGICEELCKIVPVLIYIFWKKRAAQPLTIVLIGVFSGLGFAAFENMHYANRAVLHSASLTYNHGAAGLKEGVTSAMVNVLLRSMSLVFVHAIYSGIFSYFIALGHITQNRRVALALVGLLVAATVHGLYNSFWQVQSTLPAIVAAAAFMLFYSYLTKLRLVMVSREIKEKANY